MAKKMEVRTVAAVISIWRLVLYLNATMTEVSSSSSSSSMPWSTVLESMSIWHFARLMIKTINILQTPWLDILNKVKLYIITFIILILIIILIFRLMQILIILMLKIYARILHSLMPFIYWLIVS